MQNSKNCRQSLAVVSPPPTTRAFDWVLVFAACTSKRWAHSRLRRTCVIAQCINTCHRPVRIANHLLLMRVSTGFCLAGLYVVAESWLNGMAENHYRGRLLAIYNVVTIGAWGMGQLLFQFDARNISGFAFAAIVASLAVVPISISEQAAAPEVQNHLHLSLRELAKLCQLVLAQSCSWVRSRWCSRHGGDSRNARGSQYWTHWHPCGGASTWGMALTCNIFGIRRHRSSHHRIVVLSCGHGSQRRNAYSTNW